MIGGSAIRTYRMVGCGIQIRVLRMVGCGISTLHNDRHRLYCMSCAPDMLRHARMHYVCVIQSLLIQLCHSIPLSLAFFLSRYHNISLSLVVTTLGHAQRLCAMTAQRCLVISSATEYRHNVSQARRIHTCNCSNVALILNFPLLGQLNVTSNIGSFIQLGPFPPGALAHASISLGRICHICCLSYNMSSIRTALLCCSY